MPDQIISDDFKKAIVDYLYLIERNYPFKSILKIIGDRYRLNSIQRSVLMRGVYNKKVADLRKNKIIDVKYLVDNTVSIDCYNVLITIASYITGKFVYVANDGFLRDAAESHGKLNKQEAMERALDLCINYLKDINDCQFVFYLDKPVSYSVDFAKHINDKLNKNFINGSAKTVKSADFYLIENKDTIGCTSDAIIIDKMDKILDLAYNVIMYNFKPDLFYVEKFINLF
jgi:hypothetical protein